MIGLKPVWFARHLLRYQTIFGRRVVPAAVSSLPFTCGSDKVLAPKAQQKLARSKSKDSPVIEVWEGMTVRELSAAARSQPARLLSTINSGILASQSADLNSKIEDRSLLISLVHLLGYRPLFKSPLIESHIDKDAYPRPPCLPSECVARPPVVAILGHVDHGKTTLLDALRATRMVDQEYGGITQHLAAFTVSLASVAAHAGVKDLSASLSDSLSNHITFLDTPGHAAFSAIRARGAKVTDIIVLVVAADDGVMPQTVESIRFAKEAMTPIVVAINKIDKRGANIDNVIEGLATHGVVVEQLGGEVQAVEISALKQLNLSSLLEAIILQAEIMQLKSDPSGAAEAIVLESKMEHGTGKVATCLVTRGQLKKAPESGPLVAGETVCSPRMIFDDMGRNVNSVGPGYIARVAGWKDIPAAGSLVLELDSQSRANEVVRFRRNVRMQKKASADYAAYTARIAPYKAQYEAFLEERSKHSRGMWRMLTSKRPDLRLLLESDKNESPCLNLVIKADVHGSLEAIQALLSTCPSNLCSIEFGQIGVGPLTESDVENAAALGANILLFNVPALPNVVKLAKSKGVPVTEYNIIYRLAEDVRDMVNARLPPLVIEKVIGEAEVLALFWIREQRGGSKPVRVPVAGCRCLKGQLLAGMPNPRSFTESIDLDSVLATHYRVIRPTQSVAQSQSSGIPEVGDGSSQPLGDTLRKGTLLVSQARCRSLRHERTVVDSVRKGVECGISLIAPEVSPESSTTDVKNTSLGGETIENFFCDWQVGDIIQCYLLVNQPQRIEWEFETKSTDEE
ncbi:unnamed protein product [Calicophoron daubneyi]|uniref:Tr-type G domain-containing protein n=1 Tax=Calicophoron daubneyi TaxID=300641 RepID=A0AAV2TMG6_CALDB